MPTFTHGYRVNVTYEYAFVAELFKRACHRVSLPAVYTIQPVVKPVVKRVWQPVKCLYTWYTVVSCIQTFSRLSIRFNNRFNNTLYRVNGTLSTNVQLYVCRLLSVCQCNDSNKPFLMTATVTIHCDRFKRKLPATLRWFTAEGAIRIALRQLLQNRKWRHWWRHNLGSRWKLQKNGSREF